MVAVLSRFIAFTNRHPVVRGMMLYGTLWPTSCLIQQTIAGKTIENYDWMQALRFSLFGGLFTAPALYAWLRISARIWPGTSFKTAITKALVEQCTYGPAQLFCFFFGLSLLEGKSIEDSKKAVEQKFVPTWKVGVCCWPIIQTINYRYIPEKSRVLYAGVCSLLWCCFLAYMHQLQLEKKRELKLSEQLLTNAP